MSELLEEPYLSYKDAKKEGRMGEYIFQTIGCSLLYGVLFLIVAVLLVAALGDISK